MGKRVKNQKGRKNKNSTLQKSGKHEKYNIDDEIVIGLNVNDISRVNIQKANTKKTPKKDNKVSKMIKWLSILFLIIIAILLFFMSPIFNLEEIRINGNNIITTNECLELSKLEVGQNIYQISKKQIKDNIKKNAYVEKVYVSRKLPNIIEITIQERERNFMLELENNEYAYINNQGYILEKNYNKLDSVIITGFSTKAENIIVGNRLCDNDLKRLENVLKIVDAAQINNLLQYITKIDIEDKNDYKLILEEEKKVVHLGDITSISTRMLYLKAILEKEKGIEGEVFINGNVNTDKAFFREKV